MILKRLWLLYSACRPKASSALTRNVSHVARCTAPPAPLVVAGEAEIVPLPGHPGRDQADAGPGAEPRADESKLGRVALEEREAESGGEEGTAVSGQEPLPPRPAARPGT